MPDFSDILQELREQFLQSVAERFTRIENLIATLESASTSQVTNGSSSDLKDLLRQFHSLSGAGGTYGFQNVSQFGRVCEEECELLLQNYRLPEAADLERWRVRLEDLKRELETKPGSIA